MNKIKNVNNNMSNNILNRNPRNKKIFIECPTSQKNTRTISTKKTMTKTISSINLNKKNKIENKKSKNFNRTISQNRIKKKIPPSIILNYSKSLYFYNKIQFINRFLNMRINNKNNTKNHHENIIKENGYNRKNFWKKELLDSLNNLKIINIKKINNNEKKTLELNIRGIKSDYKEKVIKIQSFIRSLLLRNKIKKKLKYLNRISKSLELFEFALSIRYKKNIFLMLKNKYLDNQNSNNICLNNNEIKNDETPNKNDNLNSNANKLIDIDINNKISIKILNNTPNNKIKDSENVDIIIKNEENNKNEVLLDELNNNYQKAINENKNLEQKLNETTDDYNKLKEKIKDFEKTETKYNDILKENVQLKQDIVKQKEELLKEIELIKDNYKKLLEEKKENILTEDENREKEDKKEDKNIKIKENITEEKENKINEKKIEENENNIQEKRDTIKEKEEPNENKEKEKINIEKEEKEKEEKKVKKVLFNLNVRKNSEQKEEIPVIKKKRSSLKSRDRNSINLINITENRSSLFKCNDAKEFINNDSNHYIANNSNNIKYTNSNNFSNITIGNNTNNKNETIFSFNSDESDQSNNSVEEDVEKKEKEKEKIKKLKNVIKNKIESDRDFLHKYFSRFYYNGLFLKMIGRLPKRTKTSIYKKPNSSMCLPKSSNLLPKILNKSKLEKEEEIKIENKRGSDFTSLNININTNNILPNNINNNTQETILDDNKNKTEKYEVKTIIKRVEKAKGLRKLLSRKVKEKKEILREYFYKFYRAGILAKVRSVRRLTRTYIQRTSQGNNLILNIENALKKEDKSLNLFYSKSQSVMIEKEKEKEEFKLKRKQILEKILYKTDRKNVKIMRNFFEKYYLRAKLESFGNNILPKKKKKKKKKKVNKKESKEKDDNKEFEEDEKGKEEEKIG